MARRNRKTNLSEEDAQGHDEPCAENTEESVESTAAPETNIAEDTSSPPQERHPSVDPPVAAIGGTLRQHVEPYVAEAQEKLKSTTEAIRQSCEPYVSEVQHRFSETKDSVVERTTPLLHATHEKLNETKKAIEPYVAEAQGKYREARDSIAGRIAAAHGAMSEAQNAVEPLIAKTHAAVDEVKSKISEHKDAAYASAEPIVSATKEKLNELHRFVDRRMSTAAEKAAHVQQVGWEKLSLLVQLLITAAAYLMFLLVAVLQRLSSTEKLEGYAKEARGLWSVLERRAAAYPSGSRATKLLKFWT